MDAKEAIARFFCKAARAEIGEPVAVELLSGAGNFPGAGKVLALSEALPKLPKPVLAPRGALESAAHTRGRSGKRPFLGQSREARLRGVLVLFGATWYARRIQTIRPFGGTWTPQKGQKRVR